MGTNQQPAQTSSFKVEKIDVDINSGKGTIIVDMQPADAQTLQRHIDLGSHVSVNLVIQAKGPVELAAEAAPAPVVSVEKKVNRPTSIEEYTHS